MSVTRPSGTHSAVFGPVPSRRLGYSLGVDVVPHKLCPYDCVYCQIGTTTCKSTQRGEFVPLQEVLDEIQEVLDSGVVPDYITISGSGEPTLYSRLGELVDGIRKFSTIPTAVITNGALLSDAQVRLELMNVDLVMPSLDAGNEAVWRAVNRPGIEMSYDAMVAGLESFSREYRGTLWLEILFVEGFGDPEKTVEQLKPVLARVKPQRIQLNTVVRPPAESSARPVSRAVLEKMARRLGPHAEVIVPFEKERAQPVSADLTGEILGLLARRPCTAADIAAGLGQPEKVVGATLDTMKAQGTVTAKSVDGREYFDVFH